MKRCSLCGEEKPLAEFHKRAAMKDGRRSECKVCCNKAASDYKAKNKDRVTEYNRQWKQENKARDLEITKAWRQKNLEYTREYARDYVSKNRYPEKHREEVKEWRKNNTDKVNAYARARRETDTSHKVLVYMRNRLYAVLKGKKKSASTTELVGCSLEYLLSHIEAQFQEGMNWGNYGEWHIDHIIPCASFDFADPQQQRICFHYSNLQPLWAIENIKKGARVSCGGY